MPGKFPPDMVPLPVQGVPERRRFDLPAPQELCLGNVREFHAPWFEPGQEFGNVLPGGGEQRLRDPVGGKARGSVPERRRKQVKRPCLGVPRIRLEGPGPASGWYHRDVTEMISSWSRSAPRP